MLLSANLLNNVASVNVWEYVTEVGFTQGDSTTVYLQLIDLNKDRNGRPPGKRYMPATGATLQVTLRNVDSSKTVTKVCSQSFTNDGSIWQFAVIPTDNLNGMYTLTMQLTEGTVNTYGRVTNAIRVTPQSGIMV